MQGFEAVFSKIIEQSPNRFFFYNIKAIKKWV
jgi:hypothetical protein